MIIESTLLEKLAAEGEAITLAEALAPMFTKLGLMLSM